MPRNPACSLCHLSKNTKSICTWGKGNLKAAIFAVGEALGEQEDREGLPFVGPAGRVLDQALAKAGINPNEIYITNIAKCHPPNNRIPEPSELRACFPYLIEEIQSVQPKIIIALGGTALKVLSGRDSITRARGSFLDPAKGVRLGGAKLLATYHPAAYLHARNPAMLQGLIDDLTFAAKLIREPNRAERLPANEVALLPPGYSAEDLSNALNELRTSTVLAMDCEWTYMTDRRIAWPWTRGAELYSISISGFVGTGVQTVAFSCPLTKENHAVLATFLKGRKIVFHNAMADLIWLHGLKLPITLAGDTMLLAHLFNETAELKLEVLAETWIGVENWKSTENYRRQRPLSQEAWEDLLRYNAFDTYVTLLLMQALYTHLRSMPESERVDTERFYKNLTLASLPMFVRIAIRGMPLSLKKVLQATTIHEQKLTEYGAELAATINNRTLEAIELANSPAQVKKLLHASFGIEADTTNSYAMDALAEQYPVCQTIQNIKHETKTLGTYLRPWAQMLQEQGDGRLHSVYSVVAAVTSRTSAQTELGASVQLVMREEWMRDLFEAEEGYELDSADQAQLEMRVAAVVAPEPGLLERFNQGIDPHLYTASSMTGITIDSLKERLAVGDKKAKDQRQAAKPLNFGLLFGMQPDKLRIQAKKDYKVDFTIEQATEFRTKWIALHPVFEPWWRRCEVIFQQQGFVRTLLGSYRHWLPDSNKVCNTLVQSPATELVMRSLIDLDQYYETHPELGAQLVGFVHDSGITLHPTSKREEVANVTRQIMEHPPLHLLGVSDLGIPLEVEIKTGRTWQ